MKIQKFLLWIQNTLLNYPDISFHTVKIFIQEFNNCLSNTEKGISDTKLIIQTITELTLKQITLNTFLLNSKINSLDNDLNNIKKDDKID